MTLKAVLEQKTGGIANIRESESMLVATQQMYNKQVGSLLVYSDTGEPVGILTERDILRFCVHRFSEGLDKVKVSEVMTRDLIAVTPETTIDDAMTIITTKRFRHLPVVEKGKIVGIISIGDLVKAKLHETAVEAKYLRDYIAI